MTRPSSAILPHVPSTTTVIPPTTHGIHTDCANSSPLSATAVADHASHVLTCHDGDRVMERPNRNRNESPPVLPAPALPPTLCYPFTGGDGHSPNTCNVTHPMVLRLPAVSTKLYLQPADDHPFPSESQPSTAMSDLPCRPDARNPEHDKPLHTTIALQVSNGCSGDALSSRTDDLPAEPADHLTTCGRGAQGRGWWSSQTHLGRDDHFCGHGQRLIRAVYS